MVTGQIELNLSCCSIDDLCLGMLLGISTEHAETSCTSSVLESVETLNWREINTQTLGLLTLPELLSPTTL